jgi:hypothetical protein
MSKRFPSHEDFSNFFSKKYLGQLAHIQHHPEKKIAWIKKQVQTLVSKKMKLVNWIDLLQNHVKILEAPLEFINTVVNCIQQYSNAKLEKHAEIIKRALQFFHIYLFECIATAKILLMGIFPKHEPQTRQMESFCTDKEDILELKGCKVLLFSSFALQLVGKAFWEEKSPIVRDGCTRDVQQV